MGTSSLFGAKNIGFFRNLWCVRTDKGGWASADNWSWESFFHDFVRTSFMDCPLSLWRNCKKKETFHSVIMFTQKWKSV